MKTLKEFSNEHLDVQELLTTEDLSVVMGGICWGGSCTGGECTAGSCTMGDCTMMSCTLGDGGTKTKKNVILAQALLEQDDDGPSRG